jgi:hypothetical protein
MVLSELHLLSTKNRPEFLFNPAGVIKIKGRALLVDQDKATDKIWNWIDAYIDSPARVTNVIIELEYLNSFSSIILVNLLKKLSRSIARSGNLIIKWYHEADDEDIKERGQAIASIIDFPIEFILIQNITSL